MSMQIVNLIQGTPEWHAHRAKHFNASDAPAMMGCSSYKTRSKLVKELATGLTGEVDAATQRRFDDGHRFEALARPLAEEIIGEDLSPCVGVKGKYSASFDGLTFMHDVSSEHKTLNKALREAMFEGCTGADLAQPVAQDLKGLVAHKAAEDLAGVDAQEAITAAQASAAADSSPLLTLGQLNTRMEGLGLGKISAATLEHHGIAFSKERSAVQITEANARRLMLLLSLGYRKLADDLQAVNA